MADKTGYALDLSSPVRHVATELDRVAPAALSLGDLADTYRHPNHADLVRVKQHESRETDHDAVLWLMKRAIELIERRGKSGAVQIVAENGGYRLADGITFEDLRHGGKKLHRTRDDHAQLRDPFNPMSGEFSDNIRRIKGDSMDELRESMQTFGWVEQFPAIKDERGVVLVGHRRLAVAAELGIEPVVTTVRLGDGDEADAKRFRLAIASNLGGKPFTPNERKRIAAYLYGEHEWSQERIAQALNVSQSTVRDDVRELVPSTNSSRRGRPRNLTPEQEQEVIDLYFEQGKSMDDAAKIVIGPDAGRTPSSVIKVIDQERGRREERARACVCPNCGNIHQRNAESDAEG